VAESVLGVDDLGSVLSSAADHPQGMTGILFDVYQFSALKIHFHPATSGTDPADPALDLKTVVCWFVHGFSFYKNTRRWSTARTALSGILGSICTRCT
jgi:hypothetical protein